MTSFSERFARLSKPATRWAALVAVGALLATAPARAIIYVYDNQTSGATAFVGSDTDCNNGVGALTRTFTVSETFNVSTIALGLNLTHAERGDYRIRLIAPNGTGRDLITQGTDTDDNYDILLSSNSEGALDDNDVDPVAEPYYSRLVSVASGTMNFFTGNANGTWTLRVCDRDNNGTNGTFNRARLILTSTESIVQRCTGTETFDWGDFDGNGVGNCDATFTSNTTAGGLTTTMGATVDLAGAGSPPNFVTRSELAPCFHNPQGDHNGYYAMSMDAATGQDSEALGEQATFNFNVPFYDLTFSLLDVDWTNNAWEDQTRVVALDALGSQVPYTIVNHSANQIAGNLSEGDTAAAVDSDTSRVDYRFSRGVSSVTVEYTQGDEPATSAVFQIIGISDFAMCGFDYGDAPATYGTAARHTLGSDQIYLGSLPGDGETGQQSSGSATADDATNPAGRGDDEDGVPSFPANTAGPGGTYTVPGIVVHNTSGAQVTLCGWIDFDINGGAQDGTFQSDEGSCTTVPASGNGGGCVESPAGTFTCSLSWTVPADYVRTASATFARFRATPASAGMTTASFNTAINQPGEVEDYQIASGTLPVTVAMVESETAGADLVVRWTTATETSNVGFRLWSVNGRGGRDLLGTYKSQKVDSFEPLYYEATVPGRGVSAILVEDISILGRSRFHGPFAVNSRFGEDPEPQTSNWAALRAEAGVDRMDSDSRVEPTRATPTSRPQSAVLRVREEGIQRVTFEQLLAAGVDLSGVPAHQIAIVDRGQGYPRFVHSPGSTFGPGSYVEFYFSPTLTLQSPYDAVLLLQDARRSVSPAAMRSKPGSVTTVLAETRIEAERAYSFAAPSGDPWFEAQILSWGASARYERAFDLPELAEGPSEMTVRGWGYGDLEGSQPDHHVVVELNGVAVGEVSFDGIAPFEVTFDASGLLLPEDNRLVVQVPGDVPYPFDNVAYDGLEVSYQRWTRAVDDRFTALAAPEGPFQIDGFAPGESVSLWRIAAGGTGRMAAVAVTGSVSAPGGGSVHAAGPNGMRTPEIAAGIPSAISRVGGQYVIVTHPALSAEAQELASFQRSRGLKATVVDVDRIYAAFSDYAPSSEAVRSFVRSSVAAGVRYVLLAGSDTSDPYDHLGLGSYSLVPTDYVDLGQIVRFSPTDETYVDVDGDGIGDAAVGRLPARTPAELDAMIAKIRAWDASTGLPGSALFVSGASDGSGEALGRLSELFAAALPGWQRSFAAVDEIGTPSARAALLASLDGGAKVVSYVGHSSTGQWDWNPVLRWQDVDSLTGSGASSLVTAWGCWNSYFVEPNVESLAAHLLRLPDGGAVAGIGATTLTSEDSHRELGRLFFGQVSNGATRVGDALREAKRQLALSGGGRDAILGMTLLGDPAMPISPGN